MPRKPSAVRAVAPKAKPKVKKPRAKKVLGAKGTAPSVDGPGGTAA